jgi:uncharacterized membrane protein YqhA
VKFIERIFETILWNSRLIIIVAVIASILVALAMLVMTTVDVLFLLGRVLTYVNPALSVEGRDVLQLQILGDIVTAIDGYLLAAVLIIFGLGLYELFINKIDQAEGSDLARRLLLINNLDDLKDRLARVILLILVVKFLEQALKIKYTNTQDLLFLALGILMIGGAIFLSHLRSGHSEGTEHH